MVHYLIFVLTEYFKRFSLLIIGLRRSGTLAGGSSALIEWGMIDTRTSTANIFSHVGGLWEKQAVSV